MRTGRPGAAQRPSRPPGARPAARSTAATPSRPASRPSPRPPERLPTRPGGRPESRSGARPEARPTARPGARPDARPRGPAAPRPIVAAPPRAAPPRPDTRAGARLIELDEVEITIEKLVTGGEGIGRFEGIPIFVPRSAPGDRVRVTLSERRPGYGRGEIAELLAPGPGRREPPCPHFGRCGGCDLQHLDDDVQTRLKAEALLETLRRLSGLAVPAPRALISGRAWGYRLRTQVHTKRIADRGVQVGYFARRSRELVPVESCAVLEPALEREVVTLARRLPAGAPARLDVALGDGGEVSFAPLVEGLPHGELSRRVGDFVYAYDARCFFQGHAGLLSPLVEVVVGDETGETAVDLYGGVGLFALPLARRYGRVTLVEGDRIASRFARRNVRGNDVANVDVVAQAVESWVPAELPDGIDRVVVDPPRDGLSAPVRALLVGRAPRRLTYVSCHAAALARDLEELAPVFAIESLALLDLFPQTGHMEAVVQLVRRAPAERGSTAGDRE